MSAGRGPGAHRSSLRLANQERTPPDHALVRAWQQGDSAAAEQLIALYYPYIARYMHARIRDPTLVEDLTQETFVEVTRQVQSLRNPHGVALWLTRIAQRLRAQAVERLAAERTLLFPLEAAPEPASRRSVDERMLVQELVEQLEPELQQALVLLGVLDLPVAEAAARLQIHPGTLYRRRARLRRRLLQLGFSANTDAST